MCVRLIIVESKGWASLGSLAIFTCICRIVQVYVPALMRGYRHHILLPVGAGVTSLANFGLESDLIVIRLRVELTILFSCSEHYRLFLFFLYRNEAHERVWRSDSGINIK